MATRALALAALCLAAARGEDHWALLVAGSSSFFNYRHQADVCHAYHVLTQRGFHPDNIITMMYDDVANSRENPFRGKLFNFPWKSMDEAVDVYKGCKIDYSGKEVTPDKFVAVLTGDAAKAGGKVLGSGAGDHVFVNFVDHGGVGLIAFPEGAEVLHAKRLIGTLEAMHQKGMYKQLTFYLETCESGSMFEGLLPASLPVYALTASNAQESSWGTFCGSEATVANQSVGSCLGDLFSVNWMLDSDANMGKKETLAVQFARVRKLTSKSHVMQYGQAAKFGHELVSDFQGPGDELFDAAAGPLAVPSADAAHASAVGARDVKLDQLYHNYLVQGTREASERLIEEIKARQAVKDLGAAISAAVLGGGGPLAAGPVAWTPALLACHERAVAAFGASCGWSEGRLVLSRTLYELCRRTAHDAAPIAAALGRACAPSAPAIYA